MSGEGTHAHTKGCACDHDDDTDGEWLLPVIDLDHVSALNELRPGSVRSLFRPFERRHDPAASCESNAGDSDLIVYLPFTSSVKVKSIAILGVTDETTPRDLHLYVNRDDIDFTTLDDTPPVQTLALSVDADAALAYPLRVARFANASSITLVFRGVHGGGDQSALRFIGLKGVATGHRRGIVTAVYEAKPLPQDHRVTEEGKGGVGPMGV